MHLLSVFFLVYHKSHLFLVVQNGAKISCHIVPSPGNIYYREGNIFGGRDSPTGRRFWGCAMFSKRLPPYPTSR